MADPHLQQRTSCGVCASLRGPDAKTPLWEDELWHVRHIDPPHPVPGWMMLITKRHVGGPAHFDDREAASFGPVLRHLERVLEKMTGALRIYTAALGESHPHFHCHMVPRYAEMPGGAKAWGVFDLQRRAVAGEISADADEVQRVCDFYGASLKKDPPRY